MGISGSIIRLSQPKTPTHPSPGAPARPRFRLGSRRSVHPANRIPVGGGPQSRARRCAPSHGALPVNRPPPRTPPRGYPPPAPLQFRSRQTIISTGVTSETMSGFSRFFMGGGCPSPTRRGDLLCPGPGPDPTLPTGSSLSGSSPGLGRQIRDTRRIQKSILLAGMKGTGVSWYSENSWENYRNFFRIIATFYERSARSIAARAASCFASARLGPEPVNDLPGPKVTRTVKKTR